MPRLFPPFVPALHVLPGVADVAIERGIGSGIVPNLADRATVGEVRSAILGDYLRDSHALYVQHAVRHEPIATTHALHVQHSVRLSQAEAEIADAQSTSRGNTAAAGVSTLMDPFAIGAPAPTIVVLFTALFIITFVWTSVRDNQTQAMSAEAPERR